jgi:zinc transport system substrate-binding protein
MIHWQRGQRPLIDICAPRNLLAAGVAGSATELEGAPLQVAVSILPQTYFLARIGAERVAVTLMVDPGESPATYEPTPRQLAGLTHARAYFRIGVPMEQALVPRLAANYPDLVVIDTRTQETDRHDHTQTAPTGHLHHGESDPHSWLSPRLAAGQAAIIGEALTSLDPLGADTYRRNLAELQTDLAALAADVEALLAPVRGGEIFVFHPAYGSLCADYGLVQVAIESGGLAPSPRHLAEVLSAARAAGARAIFVQPQSSTTTAATVASELEIELVTLDPLARDYEDNLLRIARAFRAALDPDFATR